MEQEGSIVIARHAGTHTCSDADHELGRYIRSLLATKVQAGKLTFLLDVRELTITYPSGLADLWGFAWSPVLDKVDRVAILWRRDLNKSLMLDRIGHLASLTTSAEQWNHRLQFFEDEEAAMRFLRAENDAKA